MSEPQDSGTRGSHSLSPIIPTTDPELVGHLVPNLVPLAGLPADTCAGNQVFALTGADDVPQLPSRSPFRPLFLYLGEHGCRPPGHPTAAQGSLVASADMRGKESRARFWTNPVAPRRSPAAGTRRLRRTRGQCLLFRGGATKAQRRRLLSQRPQS